MYPLCRRGYMKSKIFQKSQYKAKIGQKGQFFKKKQKKQICQKKAKIIQNLVFFCQILAFVGNFVGLGLRLKSEIRTWTRAQT
jgi:hypothetical protein